MSLKILALGASSSKQSINKRFATYAAGLIPNATVNLVDLNDYEMPIFSVDREKADGIHELALKFKQLVGESDGIVISFAEHNSSYSSAYKNVYDWVSRIEQKVWNDKPMLLLGTSPGGRGARTVLDSATAAYTRQNSSLISTFSLPRFYDNFDGEKGIMDAELKTNFDAQLSAFIGALQS